MADDELTPADAPAEAAPGGTPLDVPLEQQITALPALTYPGGQDAEFQEWASSRRRGRIRMEVGGGVLLLLAGVAGWLITQRPTFLAVAVFAVAALAAYEFLVDSFE